MAKITYDPEVKILSIRLKNTRSTDSVLEDNCVIDFDDKGDITNIEIMEIDFKKLAKKLAR